MKRPWQIWTAFGVSFAIVLAAMAWVSFHMLRLERRNAEARHEAAVEEVVRLALWRMDAAISPMLMKESARPYFEYASFNPAGVLDPNNLDEETQIPSPLLMQPTTNVLVYFNGRVLTDVEDNTFSSPQVPEGRQRGWALQNPAIKPVIGYNDTRLHALNAKLTVQDIQQALGATTVIEQVSEQVADNLPNRENIQTIKDTVFLNFTNAVADVDVQQWVDQVNQGQQIDMQPNPPPEQQVNNPKGQQTAQARDRNNFEYFSRYQQKQEQVRRVQFSKKGLYQSLGNKNWKGNRGQLESLRKAPPKVQVALAAKPANGRLPTNRVAVEETIMRPLWVKDLLVLARDVRVGGQNYVQGAWLDWDAIRQELLVSIRDLLPDAKLVPADMNRETDVSRLLAALPVKLIPGRAAGVPAVLPSPLRTPLVIAWICMLLAGVAVATLLLGSVSLSERRGAFVSAVTHELRTPLTTFRIYSEMLSEGMVQDAGKQQAYLKTLTAEGSRLSHLVENVLSYARLERGRTRSQVERLSLRSLVDRVQERLGQRAEQAEMQLVVELDDATAGSVLETDMSGVEQVLFNLVDNACKYAGRAADRRIHFHAMAVAGRVRLRIRDHGPGIVLSERRRLFRAFRKSAKHAAESAPGVGLGLALSRRLARQLGGDLRIDAHTEQGACFELVLKAA
jgi:signal transduction histidine kinase